ncbi:hypothetical protein AgCh_019791 [Apium graveolens]
MYNNIFALSSFGGNVDESINNGSGPYVFRLNDHVYHSIGFLLPPDGRTPKYAQFYMYDGQEAVEHRLQFPHTRNTLDPDIVDLLLQMLNRDNVLIGIFKQVRERYHISEQILVRLRLLERRTSDGRFVNLPSGNDYEFAGLAVVQNLTNPRDILVEYKTTGLERITEIHPCFMSLQYPLLFPHGEDGYRLGIKHRQVPSSDQDNQKTVSMREFQAFRLQFRIGKGHTLLLDGRPLLQYVVDAWCCIERSRLKWVERHQSIIRSNLYRNIVDSVSHGDTLAAEVGKRVVLPSSFTGGFRYMQQNFHDSLALCKEYGHPNLFVTFICNPKWVEIQRSVSSAGCGDASVRPDLVACVFKIKLDAMMSDFMKKNVVGRVVASFDSIIAYVFHVLHKHVVPYNRGLLVKYQAHINMDRCNRLQSIKYLFKYIGKGPDKVTAVMERADGASIVTGTSTSTLREKQLDEVKNYLSYRYVSSVEACWRIFEFSIHHRQLYVQRLFFHLEDEQEVRFRDDDSLPQILGRIRPDGTIFVQWLLNNRRDESGHDLIFVRYPTRYRWDNAGKFWARHKQNIDVVG